MTTKCTGLRDERKNMYRCQNCGHRIVTIDRDEGVTPFMIGCKHGGGPCEEAPMYSSFYKLSPLAQLFPPTHEWRKATTAEYRASSKEMQQYFDAGGLGLHKIIPASAS